MQPRLILANISRSTARAVTFFVIPTIIVYLLFIGLQLTSGEPGFLGLSLNMLLLAIMLVGFVLAWRRESLGATVASGAVAGFFILGCVLSGFSATFSSSPMVGPLSLLTALIKPQSFDPVPRWIIVASWALLIAPICLFFASSLLRSKPSWAEPPEGSAAAGQMLAG